MGLPWKQDIDINIASNEYTAKLSVNRCLDGLVANDVYLNGVIEAGLDRSTGLRFATPSQISTFDSVSGGISPYNLMAASATYETLVSGVTTLEGDGFITPNAITQVFNRNTVVPKIIYIDVTHVAKQVSVAQIVNSARTEINNAVPLEGSTIYVRCIWYNVGDGEDAQSSQSKLTLKTGKTVTQPFFTGKLLGHEERMFTFETTSDTTRWKFIRQRETYELIAREKADGYKSLF